MQMYYRLPLFWTIFPYFPTLSPRDTPGVIYSRRIINGFDAVESQFPYFAEVDRFLSDKLEPTTCGGVLISYNKVLTAEHCVKNSIRMEVRLGSIRQQQGKVFPVYKHFIHAEADLAVLVLQLVAKPNANIQKIKIIQRPVDDDEECTAIGFGWDGNKYSKELKYAMMHTNNVKDVQKLTSQRLSPFHLFAGMNDATDVCFGDSGGPLVCHGYLVGTVVGSVVKKPCNSIGYPSKFTNLYLLKAWIDNV